MYQIEPTDANDAGMTTSSADQPTRKRAHMAAETDFEPFPVNVRIKISALWTTLLFIFAYVDIFSLYRPDFRADVEAGEVGGFTVNQSFLLGITAYVVIPSLMVFFTLILRPPVNRMRLPRSDGHLP
jgi:cbb3-type cytochrome oxidase subunit 3